QDKNFQEINAVFVYPPSANFDFSRLTSWQKLLQPRQTYDVSVFSANKSSFPLRENGLLSVAELTSPRATLDLFMPMFILELKILGLVTLIVLSLFAVAYGILEITILKTSNKGG